MARSFTNPVFLIGVGAALFLIFKMKAAPGVEDTPEYQAACQGPPLGTVAKRYEAMEAGYTIHQGFDCIDKAAVLAEAKWRAESAAANTPEALAKKRAELAAADARRAAEREQREAIQPELALRRVDANTATEAEIADVFSIGPEAARQIVEQRSKRRFAGWDDLVGRVVALSAAQTAFYASTSGLTVDGKSMDGAPMDAGMAAAIYERRTGKRPVVRLAP